MKKSALQQHFHGEDEELENQDMFYLVSEIYKNNDKARRAMD